MIGAPIQVKLPPPPPMRIVPGMHEPLVAIGPVSEQENKDLDHALADFHNAPAKAGPQGDYNDYAKPLLSYIEAHSQSNWNAALYTDIGLGYYYAGYYNRTFAYLDKAWQLGRNATSVEAKRMIDRAVAELADMHARVGHTQELEALFADIGTRPISGSAQQKMEGARDGLRTFHYNPGISYLCGPQALKNILIALNARPEQIRVAEDARSGEHGFSLTQLAALADGAKLDYKLIYRLPGQPVPVPSVINWNVHHYAAIISMRDGRYQIQDPTFGAMGSDVTEKAVDAEASGYFLVPANVVAANAKSGWNIVAADSGEAKAVYGMGTTFNVLNGVVTPNDPGSCPDSGGSQGLGSLQAVSSGNSCTAVSQASGRQMTVARAHLAAVSLNLTDTPVGYRPQKGLPAFDTLVYNSRDGDQPANFTFSNVSPLWTHTWQAYIEDDPNAPGSNVTRVASGGGGYDYATRASLGSSSYSTSTGGFTPEVYDNSQLFRLPPTGTATSYERDMPDGSEEVYGLSNGATTTPRLMFLTQVIDPAGNTTTLNYDSQFRLTSVTDAMGRNTTFTYGLSNDLLITRITDPFGRHSQLTYDTMLRLSSITDPIGITSSFTYGSTSEDNFITLLTTPYGTSKFSDIPNPNDPILSSNPPLIDRSLALTDPLGNVELVYLYQNINRTGTQTTESSLPSGMTTDNGFLEWRNTYYWNRHAAAGGGVTTDSNGNPTAENFANPVIYHWFHQCCTLNYVSNQIGSVKMPLEEFRQWTNYPSQSTDYFSGTLIKPTFTGRVLDDRTTQLSSATYNSLGLPLTITDPINRKTTYSYASNNIDLLTVQQLTSSPSTYTTIATYGGYNTQHEPQTYTGADGQTWNYSYNGAGQLTTVTDPNSDVTTYNYDSLGRLSNIVNANNATALTLTYDNADRIHTRTDSEGYTLTYNYDNLDRVTRITYPDGTTDLYNYNFLSGPNAGKPSLDLRRHTDRLGRFTTYNYDADRRLTSVTEQISASQNRTTQYDYYEDGTLKDITDAKANVTHWQDDIQSRPTSKTYAYGTTSAQTETYAYETTNSRLHSITDALGQQNRSVRMTGMPKLLSQVEGQCFR